MPLFKRPDGTLVRDVPPTRRIMPYMMKGRTESTVYFEQVIDLEKTLPFIERYNASHERRVSVFHVFMWAAVRAISARPRLNRFVMGGRIYQRDGLWLSFSAKKALNDDSPLIVLKRRFDPELSFEEQVAFVYGDVDQGRSDEKSHVDKELGFFLALPGPVLRFGVALLRWLDDWNLLPGSFIHPDPMYTSLFVANLGSVRLESAFHHLYEYGNCPLFAAIGRNKREAMVDADGSVTSRRVCRIKYSFDERIEDGLYCASSLELLKQMIEDPEAHGATPKALPAAEA